MLCPWLKRLLIGEKSVVHLPVLPLLSCAVGRFSGFECLRMNRFQRKTEKYVSDYSRVDIFLLDLWGRLTGVPGAERSLVIRKLDQSQFGRALPQ